MSVGAADDCCQLNVGFFVDNCCRLNVDFFVIHTSEQNKQAWRGRLLMQVERHLSCCPLWVFFFPSCSVCCFFCLSSQETLSLRQCRVWARKPLEYPEYPNILCLTILDFFPCVCRSWRSWDCEMMWICMSMKSQLNTRRCKDSFPRCGKNTVPRWVSGGEKTEKMVKICHSNSNRLVTAVSTREPYNNSVGLWLGRAGCCFSTSCILVDLTHFFSSCSWWFTWVFRGWPRPWLWRSAATTSVIKVWTTAVSARALSVVSKVAPSASIPLSTWTRFARGSRRWGWMSPSPYPRTPAGTRCWRSPGGIRLIPQHAFPSHSIYETHTIRALSPSHGAAIPSIFSVVTPSSWGKR